MATRRPVRLRLAAAGVLAAVAVAMLVTCGCSREHPPSTPTAPATPTVPSAPILAPAPTAIATPAATPAPTAIATPAATLAPTAIATPAATPAPTAIATPAATPTPAAPATAPPPAIVGAQPTSAALDTPAGVFTAVAVGGHRDACAITESGEIVCWGWGDGSAVNTLPGRFVAIDADGGTTCAVTDAGDAACWSGSESAVHRRSGGFTTISTHGGYTCGVTEAGEVQCWTPYRQETGAPSAGESDGAEWPMGLPAPPGDRFVAVTVGFSHFVDPPDRFTSVCAARAGGEYVCWQSGGERKYAAPARVWSVEVDPSAPLVGGDFCSVNGWGRPDCGLHGARYTAISESRGHACGVTPDGVAECREWGSDARAYGMLNVMEPPDVSPARYVAISTTDTYGSPEADAFADVYGCGPNDPVDLCPRTDIFACALTDAGEAVCWGFVPNKADPPDPRPGRYVAVSDGGHHTCALTDDGAAVCWGWNNFGQASVPDGRYTAISAGRFHTCALVEGGEVVCWGLTHPPAGSFVAISSGRDRSCAVTAAGEVVCWGDVSYAAPPGPVWAPM